MSTERGCGKAQPQHAAGTPGNENKGSAAKEPVIEVIDFQQSCSGSLAIKTKRFGFVGVCGWFLLRQGFGGQAATQPRSTGRGFPLFQWNGPSGPGNPIGHFSQHQAAFSIHTATANLRNEWK